MRARVVKLLVTAALSALALTGCSTALGAAGTEHIDSFDIDYAIADSGTVHVTETIAYDFAGADDRHGIDRYLAARFSSSTPGTDRVYRYENIEVDSPSGASTLYSTSLADQLQIRIGNKNANVGGRQTYRIRYDILGAINRAQQDDGGTLDEFYWNATGHYWDVGIDSARITVTGPADVVKADCFAGYEGSDDGCASTGFSGRTASFVATDLFTRQGVTVDTAFPSGTFSDVEPILEPALPAGSAPVTAGSNDGPNPFWSPWNWGTGLVLAAGVPIAFQALVVARRRDRAFAGVTPGTVPADPLTAPTTSADPRDPIVVQYQPPKGLPVGAANVILAKTRKTVDITATLIDLAVRGHLRITEVDGGSGKKAKDYRLVATPERAAEQRARARAGTAEAADLLPHETLLLGKLFRGGRTEVTLSGLTNRFATDMRAISTALDTWIEHRGFFLDRLNRTHPLIGWALGLGIAGTIAMIAIGGGAWFLIPAGLAVGAVITLGSSKKAVRRSALGHATYLQLEGFRQYIATAEADRIRFDETEDVFSRYMPWAIAFGEADRWARVFTELAEQGKYTEQPQWYAGSATGFSAGYLAGSIASISTIGSAVSSFTSMAATSMTSTPSSSGSSGFGGGGGGGFSGGGGGGGGGGSW